MIRKTIDTANNAVIFTGDRGGKLVLGLDGMPTEMIMRLALLGLLNKGGDSYASISGEPESLAAAKAVHDALMAGTWTRAGGRDGGNALLAAMQRAFPDKPVELLSAVIEKQGDKALRKHPAIKAAILAIAAERAQAKAKGLKATEELAGDDDIFA